MTTRLHHSMTLGHRLAWLLAALIGLGVLLASLTAGATANW
jgi:hypothetical protein